MNHPEISHLGDEDGRNGEVNGRPVLVDGAAHGQDEACDPWVDIVLCLCRATHQELPQFYNLVDQFTRTYFNGIKKGFLTLFCE